MSSRFTLRDVFYFSGLLLITISTSLVGRTYLFLIPHLNPALKFGSILFFLIALFYKDWQRDDIVKTVIIAAIVLTVAVITDANKLFIYILAIIASKPEDFNKICRFIFWMNLFLFFTAISLCGVGILQDEIIIHNGLEAHTLGYAYYSSPAYSVLFLTILGYYLYSGMKNSFRRIVFYIVSTIANYWIYQLTTTRLSFYIYLGMLLLIVVFDYLGVIQQIRFNKILGTFMYPFLFFVSIVLPFVYTSNSILVKLDAFLNGRLYFSKMGFDRYNVNLFGNMIITDAGGFDENWNNTYFYIDSGYVYLLLGYGVILCIIVLLVYTMCSRCAAERKNSKLFIWCILICVFSFVNDPLTDIILNPLLFITVPLFHEMREKRKREKWMDQRFCDVQEVKQSI